MKTAIRDLDNHLIRLSGKKRPVKGLVILVTAFVCVLVLGSAASFIAAYRRAELADATVANTNLSRMVAVQVASTLKIAGVTLTDLAERVEIGGMAASNVARLDAHMVQLVAASPELHGLFLYGADGSWLATSLRRHVIGNNLDREYFAYHRANPGSALHVGPPSKAGRPGSGSFRCRGGSVGLTVASAGSLLSR